MPTLATITAFYNFTAGATIASAQVVNNFGVFRGHLIPVDPTAAAAAASGEFDVGSDEHYWRNFYGLGLNLYVQATIPSTPPAGFAQIFIKDGNAYFINDSGTASPVAGLPAGGTVGQIIVKNSSVTGDASWQDPSTQFFPTIWGSALTGGAAQVPLGTGINGANNNFNKTLVDNVIFVEGNTTTSNGLPLTANPQIEASDNVGSRTTLLGPAEGSDKIITFIDGNGLSLNGDWEANPGAALYLMYDGVNHREIGRKP